MTHIVPVYVNASLIQAKIYQIRRPKMTDETTITETTTTHEPTPPPEPETTTTTTTTETDKPADDEAE